MLYSRPTRARTVHRRPHAVLALSLSAVFLLASAVPASATTRDEAANNALKSLGSREGTSSVVVFGVKKPVRAGTRVTQTRANGSKRLVIKAGAERSFLFYEDATPFSLGRHQGRVALVGAKSGKVRLSKTIMAPLFATGKLPVALGGKSAGHASTYRVYYRVASNIDAQQTQQAPSSDPSSPASVDHPNSPPKADTQDVTAKQDAPKHIRLTGSDGDGDTLLFAITKQPDHGTLSGAPPDVTYTPNAGYLGRDDFSFKTYDEIGHSNTAKVSIDVVPLGSPPVTTASAGCTAYTEQTPAVVIDGLVSVADPDDTVLDSATVRVAVNFQDGDELLFTDQNGITGSYDDLSDVLNLTGTASVADYEAALRSITYRNLSNGSPTATKDVAFTVNDAGSDSAPATKQICITEAGPNNKPIAETSEGVLSYSENDGPLPLDGIINVMDADSGQLSGATVKFTTSQPSEEDEVDPGDPGSATSTFAPGEDALAFTDQNGITGSYDSDTGALTLSGLASVANYQTALQSVTYENSSENPSEEPRLVRFQVTDSAGANSVPSSRQIFVTRVNDAPVVTTSSGSTAYTEQASATAVDSGLTVGDVDDTSIEGGKVAITAGFEAGDQLGFVDQSGISGVYDTGTGELTLSGTASVADYEAALRSITYSGTSDTPAALKTVEFQVSDGELDSSAAAKDIAVTAVNDSPVLAGSGGSVSYTEGDAPVVVDSAMTASDVDSAQLSGATVQISSGFASGEDSLEFTDQNGITGTYDSGTGVLTLSGSASIADYVTALSSVGYSNSSDNPSAATRTVTFQVDDGGAENNLSNTVSRDVNVTPVNDAPVVTASDGSTTYVEETPGIDVDPDLTVSDVDDANLEAAQVRISSGFEAGDELVFTDTASIDGDYDSGTGVLTLTGTATVADYETALRSIQFSHTGDEPTPSRTVEFVVNDGDVDSGAGTKSIDIVPPPNQAPVVTASEESTPYLEGGPDVPVDAAIAVSDEDDTSLEGATVSITGGFEPGDALAFADTATIDGDYDSGTGVLTLTGTATVLEYEAALRSVLFGHTGDAPGPSRSVEFKVNDGDLDSSAAIKAIDVTALPPPPPPPG